MSDSTLLANATVDGKGGASVPPTAEISGIHGRKISEGTSFASPPKPSQSSAKGGSKIGGDKKGPGRPPKNVAGLSREKIDEVVDDPEIEAARAEFESVLVSLLVTTSDNLADARFEILKSKFPPDMAQVLADKARLTEKEKQYFGGVAIRLWRKYLGDKYLFTDEGICAVYGVQYMLRNWEPMNQVRKIEKEKIDGTKPTGGDQQPGLQSSQRPDSGSQTNGKEHSGLSVDRLAPRAISPHL